MVWTQPRTDLLVPLYWIAGYVATEEVTSTELALTSHPEPSLGGQFGDDSIPSVLDDVVSLDIGSPVLHGRPTWISLHVPPNSAQGVLLYDPAGRLIETVCEAKGPGDHRIRWSPGASERVPSSGVFFLAATDPAGKVSVTRKVVVVR